MCLAPEEKTMDSNPAVSLPAVRGTGTQPSPVSAPPLSPSGSLPIRAPLSSDDNDSLTDGSDAETFTTAGDDEGFETASDSDVTALSGMPIAQLTGDDDVTDEEDVFEEADGDGFPTVARVPSVDQNTILADAGGVSDGENSSPAEISKDGVLGVEATENLKPENPPEAPTTDEATGTEPADSVVAEGASDSAGEAESDAIEIEKDEHQGGGSGEGRGEGEAEPTETEPDAGKVQKDGAANTSGSDGNLEWSAELEHEGPGANAVEVEKIGAVNGAESDPNHEPVSAPAAEIVELEARGPFVEGEAEPDADKVKKDGATITSGSDGNLKGAVESEHQGPGADAVEVDKIRAGDGGESDLNHEPVSVPAGSDEATNTSGSDGNLEGAVESEHQGTGADAVEVDKIRAGVGGESDPNHEPVSVPAAEIVEPMETEPSADKVKKDGAADTSGSDGSLEGAVESEYQGPGADVVEVEKIGSGAGGESDLNHELVSVPAAEIIESEVRGPIVEGEAEPTETEPDAGKVNKDGATNTSGSDGNLEGAVESEHQGPGSNAVEVGKIGAGVSGESDLNHQPVSIPAADIVKSEARGPAVEGEAELTETKLDVNKMKKDGATNTFDSDGNLEGAVESEHQESGADVVEVEKIEAGNGVESDLNHEPVSIPAVEVVELEARGPVVEGEAEPMETEPDADRAKKDAVTNTSGSDGNLEGAVESEHQGPGVDAVGVEKIGAGDGVESDLNHEPVSVPAAEIVESEARGPVVEGEAEPDADKMKKDGATNSSGSNGNREGVVESEHQGLGVDAVEVEKIGAGDGGESDVNHEQVSVPAAEIVESEARGPVVEGEAEPDADKVKIDGATNSSGSNGNLEGMVESEHQWPGADAVEVEKIGAGEGGESDLNHGLVSVPAAKIVESEARGPVVEWEEESTETELNANKVKKDGVTNTSGSDGSLKGTVESEHQEPGVDAVEVEKIGAGDGGESDLNHELVSGPAAEIVESEGEAEPTETELDADKAKKDGATNTSGSDGNLEGAVESEHQGPGADAVEVEKIGAGDGGESDPNHEPVSVPGAEIVEFELSQSNTCVGRTENDKGYVQGSVAIDSELADGSVASSDDGGNGDVAIESLDGGPACVDLRERAADSADNLDAVVCDTEHIDRTSSPIQEIGDQIMMSESEQASFNSEAEPNVPVPELAADGGGSVSVQEVESQPILVEESESRETEREIKETSGGVDDGDSAVVSGESLTSDSVSVLEEKPVGDASHVDDDDDEKTSPNVVEEEEDDSVSEGPARVAILESYETKQMIKELEEGSSSTSTRSGFRSLRDYSYNIDGQIASDSDEDVLDTGEEDDGKELFDSDALVAFLKAATGASPDGSITIASPDATRIISVDRPAGLGSSVPSLKPASARSTRPNLFKPSDLAVAGEPNSKMDEEERKLHEKVELIRVKFLRLVQRLGHSPEDTIAAQVLYRLGLAEGIRRGRQTSQAFSLENARKKASEGKDDLDFSCNILVLGKTGVGKSATVNSIFGEEKSHTDAFELATTSVREIVGIVDGVKIRVIDTPGFRASVMDQASNRRILSSIKKYTKRCPPDIVLYVDRMDTQNRDFNDLPLLRSITSALGSSIWFNAIVALTHAASAPPDGPNGYPLSYDVFVAQRSHVVQHSIRQAAGDMRLMNPVALAENHPSCRRNRKGERVLPNGLSWRPQMLLLCYSSKILSEANCLLKRQDPSPGKLFGFRLRSPPLHFLLSSLLQSRSHPKLSVDQGGEDSNSDTDLDDLADADQEEEGDEYDELPPFNPLQKSQIAKLTKEQRRAYFDEYDYRVKLLQKKQWKEELRRLKEMKKRGKRSEDDFAYGDMAEDFDQDNVPAAVPVPLPDMILPPSFDCDYPVYRYRFLEPTSQLLVRPVLDSHGWDHDCGYDGVGLEHNLAVVGHFPAAVSVQVTKDKKEFNIHLDSSISAKHGENGSTLTGFDIQSIGKQLAYILRGETKFKNLKKNKTAAGISITFLGETVATGLKIEDQVSIGKRVGLVGSTGVVRAQGDMAYGANVEACLRDKDYPIGQSLSTLGLSLLRWHDDLALGINFQSQFPLRRNSKMAVRVGLNNKMSGQMTIRTSSSEHLQIALVGILPIAMSIYRSIWPGESIPY